MGEMLIVYSTAEGQTRKIAGRLQRRLADAGHIVRITDVDAVADVQELQLHDVVIVGSPIHRGKPQRSIVQFLTKHADALHTTQSAYFQVSLASATDDIDRINEAATYVEELLEETGWEPDLIAQFGGALRYSKYGLVTKFIMKRIAKRETGDIDTSRDYEYTDWEAVDAFAADVLELMR